MAEGLQYEELMTATELAAFLCVQEQTVRLWVCQRRIPFYRVGRCVRFRRSEIEEWLQKQRQEVARCYQES